MAEQSLTSQLKDALTKQFGEADAETFMTILGENGFDDDESILDDVKDADDSILKDDPNMTPDAFACMQRVCGQYGKEQNPFEDLDDATKMKEWKTKYDETESLYLTQCQTLVQSSRDASLKNVATLGRLHGNVPLIAYCVDTFNRFRIEEFLRSGQDVNSSDFLRMVPFYHAFNEKQKAKKEKTIDLLTTLEAYSARWTHPLELLPSTVFVDDIDDILRYIFGVTQMLGSLLNDEDPGDNDLKVNLELPFQFDLAILPSGGKKTIRNQFTQVDVPAHDDDDDDDDDEEEEEDEVQPESVQDIEGGMKKFGIKPVTFDISQELLNESTAVRTLKRELRSKFMQVGPQRNGRYVMVVDRRDSKKSNKDKIWMYSPQCEQLPDEKENPEKGPSYHRLHQNFVEESLLYKTLKCLIPSARVRLDPHYGCKQHDMITLSFHVLRKDLIKCYLFMNGGGARFEVTDLIKLLPKFFLKSSSASSTLLNRAIVERNFGLKLQDEQFEAWYKKTTSK